MHLATSTLFPRQSPCISRPLRSAPPQFSPFSLSPSHAPIHGCVPKPTAVKDPSKVGAQRNDSATRQVRLLKAKGKRCVSNNKKDGGAADVAGHTMDKRGRVAVRRSHNCPCRHRPGRSNISRSTSTPCRMLASNNSPQQSSMLGY